MQRIAEALSSLLRIVTAVTCGNLEDAGPEISDALCCSFKTQPDPCPAAAICSSHCSSSAACSMVATNTFRTDVNETKSLLFIPGLQNKEEKEKPLETVIFIQHTMHSRLFKRMREKLSDFCVFQIIWLRLFAWMFDLILAKNKLLYFHSILQMCSIFQQNYIIL